MYLPKSFHHCYPVRTYNFTTPIQQRTVTYTIAQRYFNCFPLQMLMPNVAKFYIKYNKSFNMTKRYQPCLNNIEYWHSAQSLKWRLNIAYFFKNWYNFFNSFYVTWNYIFCYMNIKCILLYLRHAILHATFFLSSI